MTDTMRTLAALATLLADNETGAISPQDLRDAVLATVPPGYAEMSLTSSAATTHGDTSTWSEVAGTWALTDASAHWAMSVNGRLGYIGAAVREVNISAAISMTAASVNIVTEWAIGIDGVPLTPSIIRRKISTGSDVGAAAVFGHADISPGSYISLMCRNTTSATTTTAELSNVVVTDFAA